MTQFGLQFNIGDQLSSFNRLVAALPQGDDNLTADIILPSHTPDLPLSLLVSNVTPNIPHLIFITAEFGVPPVPSIGFVPQSTTATINVSLQKGPNTIVIMDNQGNKTLFSVAVTHYATFFTAESQQINDYSWEPLTTLENNIESDVGYILANPLIADINRYIPTDMETLGILANKLIVKNLLWRPGTTGGTTELLAAFSGCNPYLFQMVNQGEPETFLYRSEEVYSGYEAHLWLPNTEVERWATFIQFLNNLPQLYTIVQINEGEVYFQTGDTLSHHLFNFESDFANSVLNSGLSDSCFERLFSLNMAFETEINVGFCQASYRLDNQLPALLTPDTDLLGVTNFTDWTLTGRFEQQLDISYDIHGWVYDSPVTGVVDGVNRFFTLSQQPASPNSVKLFQDGLLLRNTIDFQVSATDDLRSGTYFLSYSLSPISIDINVGEPRTFIGPVFTSVQVQASDVQFLVTATTQSLTDLTFVVSEPPAAAISNEAAILHYATPALPEGSYAGENQYGTEALPLNATVFSLTFPTPVSSINYQLLVQYGEDPSASPAQVEMPLYMVRNHTLNGATIEFSDPVTSPNALLHWWVLVGDNIGLEQGTIALTNGSSGAQITFTGGPYTQYALILQPWNSAATGDDPMLLTSFTNPTPLGATVQFSGTIEETTYFLDYVVFPIAFGNFLEISIPPSNQLIEAQYDTLWPYWESTSCVQAVDGISNVFNLPTPVLDPQSLYATLNGRLLVQGYNNQYVLTDPTTVQLTFVPQLGQNLWFVYPTAPDDTPLPSAWSQGYLTQQGSYSGSYANGYIYNASTISPGDSVTLDQVTFTAQQTARGTLVNAVQIAPGSSVTFNELGITLFGIQFNLYIAPTLIGTFAISSLDLANNTITLPGNGLSQGNTVYIQTTGTVPGGLSPLLKYFVINPQGTTIQLAATLNGSPIAITSVGTGVQSLYKGNLPTEFPCGKSRDVDGAALAAVINSYPPLSSQYYATYLGGGVTQVVALYLTGTNSNQTFSFFGSSIVGSPVTGDSYTSADEVQLISFSNIPSSGDFYLTYGNFESEYLSFSATSSDIQEALVQIPGLASASVTGDFSAGYTVSYQVQNNQAVPLIQIGGPQISFAPVNVNVDADSINLSGHGFTNGQPISFFTTGVLPGGVSSGVTYYVLQIYTVATFSPGAVDTVAGVFTLPNHGLADGYAVFLQSSLTVPTGFIAGQEYYVVNSTQDTLSLAISASGTPIVPSDQGSGTLTLFLDQPFGPLKFSETPYSSDPTMPNMAVTITDQGVGIHTVSGNGLTFGSNQVQVVTTEMTRGFSGKFAANVTQAADSASLAAAMDENEYIFSQYYVAASPGSISLTAKTIGLSSNNNFVFTGFSMTSSGISGGTEAHPSLPMLTPKIYYNEAAPVVALDGVSTTLYDGYSGNSVVFDTAPVPLQEPYFISQVFPIDQHPLDSLYANAPCSYPKGIFTQGLAAHLTSIEVDVTQTASLQVIIDNLPLQEAPSGAIDGVNQTYVMSQSTCNGQNSMLLWIDGIFQPPTTFVYTTLGSGQGQIVLSEPLVAPQKIWVWYIPEGGACANENVVALVGTQDGINQEFSIPNAPVLDPNIIVVFLEGLFNLQNTDYVVNADDASITYTGSLAPASNQSLYAHFNTGAIPVDPWRQIAIGVGDGVTTNYTIQNFITAELPTSQDSIILALNGFVQRAGVDFTATIGSGGFPTGEIVFTTAPALGRIIQTAYIRRS